MEHNSDREDIPKPSVTPESSPSSTVPDLNLPQPIPKPRGRSALEPPALEPLQPNQLHLPQPTYLLRIVNRLGPFKTSSALLPPSAERTLIGCPFTSTLAVAVETGTETFAVVPGGRLTTVS